MSRPLQSSLHLATAVRLCVHALADREVFAPQDLPSLCIAFALVRGPGRRLPLSAGSELPAVTQGLDVARGICHRSRSRRVARLDLTRPRASTSTDNDTGTGA
jgi:hypothetical protein